MGITIPQVITPDRATGAQVIDGSLKFDSGKTQHLNRTPSSIGNRRRWTWSGWVKKFGNDYHIFGAGDASTDRFGFGFDSSDKIFAFVISGNSTVFSITTTAVFRDNGWYHIVLVADTTDGTQADRFKIYVNGDLQTVSGTLMPDSQNTKVNLKVNHTFGKRSYTDSDVFDGQITNAYLIDGLALEAADFGFTDPLTNTWKPKKYDGDFGGPAVGSGTVYSDTSTVQNAETMFDGDTSTYASKAMFGDSGEYQTITEAPITFTTGTFTYNTNNGGSTGGTSYRYLRLTKQSDSSTTELTVTDTNGWTIPSDWRNITISKLEWKRWSSWENVSAVYVDGTILQDAIADYAGSNGFYLPFDGNSSIGKDESGNGNDFTPVNFGGLVALDSPAVSGARPILNTTQGGTQAGVGVFGSKQNVGYAVTVFNSGGGNKFYLDGVEAPTLTGLIRGATYTFNQTDSSNDTHPLVLATTAEGNNYGIGVSITGSPGSTGITSITIPHNAPDTLYYHCSVHSGMGSSITGITTNEKLADKYASNCTLALPLVGSSGDVSASIACTSSLKVTSNTGNVSGTSTAYNFYNGSFRFDGSGDYITVTDSSEITLGDGDFTIEYWQNLSSVSGNPTPLDKGYNGSGIDANGWAIQYSSSLMKFYVGSTAVLTDTDTTPTGKWIHWAFVRSSGTLKMYRDGIEKVSTSNSTDLSHATNLGIGANLEAGSGFTAGQGAINGYLSDIRIYKGVAKYTSNFVVPSTSPDILPDTPSGVSGSSKLVKIVDGSTAFTGIAGTYLSLADSADFDFGSGDFTVELFAYNDMSQSGNPVLVGASGGWYVQFKSGGTILEFYTGTTSIQATGLSLEGGWHHVAVTKASNVVKIFVDGILKSTTSNSDTTDLANDLYIGNFGGGSLHYDGFISNLRIIKGTALYTSRFTPPTAPLTNVTNTVLLCCQSNTSPYDAAVTPSDINAHSISSYREDTGNTNQTWDQSESATSTSSSLDANELYWMDLGSSKTVKQVTFDVVASGQSSNTSANYIIYYSTSSSSTGSSVCNGGCTQTFVPIATGTSPGTYSVTIDFPTAASARYVAITNGNDSPGGTYVYSNVKVRPSIVGASNFNPFNTDINTVRGQETGYATWNPLFNQTEAEGVNAAISDGNLYVAQAVHGVALGNFLMTSGKWYFEALIENGNMMIGVMGEDYTPNTQSYNWNKAYGIYPAAPYYVEGGSFLSTPRPNTGVVSGVAALYGVLVDIDNRKMWIHKDGKWTNNNPFTSATADVTLDGNSPGFYAWFHSAAQDGNNCTANFGQKPFKFPPPDGYQPLTTANTRPVKVISRPDQYVGVTTYSGDTSSSAIDVTGFNFKPDLVWVKKRTGATDTTARSHVWTDSVRGAGVHLRSDDNDDEASLATNLVTSFNRDGFTAAYHQASNYTGSTYVAWGWKAGTSYTPTVTGFTSPTASINTKAGFGIYKLTGNNVSTSSFTTGLNEQADFIICKNLDNAYDWGVYHRIHSGDAPSAKLLHLNNNTIPSDKGTNIWAQTGTTIEVDSYAETGSNGDYIYYVWHNVPGLQKFGKYTGNVDTDGAYIDLGFRPAIVMTKASNTTSAWGIWDSERNKSNPVSENLYPNLVNDKDAAYPIDFLSNGFKIRNIAEFNNSTSGVIYAAWAEAPSVDLYGGGANAR